MFEFDLICLISIFLTCKLSLFCLFNVFFFFLLLIIVFWLISFLLYKVGWRGEEFLGVRFFVDFVSELFINLLISFDLIGSIGLLELLFDRWWCFGDFFLICLLYSIGEFLFLMIDLVFEICLLLFGEEIFSFL